MDDELDAAAAFLASYLPTTAQPTFSRTLSHSLAARYAHHWHSADPERGSAFRALVRTPAAVDTAIEHAAHRAGLSDEQLGDALAGRDHSVSLGDRWTLWVDPGCVSLRVDRGEGAAGWDGQFIEIYGKLPDSLRSHAIPLSAVEAASSNIASTSSTSDLAVPSSPVKRSRAIQIVAPPGGRNALQAMTNAALHPDSPAPSAPRKPTALLASPLIIPPTPVRPLPATEADVFSPTPALAAGSSSSSSLLLPPRSPSPNPSSGSGNRYGALSPLSYRPSSPLGLPLFTRRSSSRTSSVSSSVADSGSGSDGETSGCDSLFSAASADSIASLTSAGSAILAGPGAGIWKGLDARSRDLVDADGFRVPALPSRPTSTAPGSAFHSRGSSLSSLAPPPSPSRHVTGGSGAMSPSAYSPASGRSLPGSPTKPRRRGVRGGQGHRSESVSSAHSHHSSVSSLASLTSTAMPSTPSQLTHSLGLPDRSGAVTPSHSEGRSRTETSSSAHTATEYSNGLVKVLGGGVLLGCAKPSAPAASSRSTTPSGEPGSEVQRRRRRERGRGGRGREQHQHHQHSHSHGQLQHQGGTSPMAGSFSLPSPYAGMPTSPVWMPQGGMPFHQQGGLAHSPMQA
ncbi:hypothetical protein JCM10207_008155 [Rhodosporidiobolus poonsookiae]